ncbi:hypothetical protein O1611_g7171 [Lasiodiplodia mahajangana]|uniref:Uncharacterized protein n=1 Tax=Lasiodiplodia mahajangana TaxID=1108764 RepID=A0ACC2JGF8_9PEZI|nr:hypothetical protein O1611_g7171 [Lasiodiplodia mahajangana]
MDSAQGRPRDTPFGYDFSDGTMRPPSPHGEPILGPNDNNLLGNFFNTNFSNGMGFGPFPEFDEEEWAHDLPDILLGHTTSYGRQPQADLAGMTIAGLPQTEHGDYITFSQNPMPPPPSLSHPPLGPLPPHQSRSQSQPTLYPFQQPHSQPLHSQRSFQAPIGQNPHEDAAALLTTLQAGQPRMYSSRTNTISNFHSSSHVQPPRNHRLSLPQAHLAPGHSGPIQLTEPNGDHTLFLNMVVGSQESTSQQLAARRPLEFGTDCLFGQGTFVPPKHESSEALERRRMAAVGGALELNSSTSNTQPSSPMGNREMAPYAALDSSNRHIKLEENGPTTPSKRRKSKAKVDTEEDGDFAAPPPKPTAKKRKSKGDINGTSDSPSVVQEASGKRRKSAPSQSKPPRENLTDAQKRENHIKSEQKRRGAIKEGFDDLTFIVPNLQNGGYSKSSMLNIAGEWLEALIKGNKELDHEGDHGH